jgi:hypothetical protein
MEQRLTSAMRIVKAVLVVGGGSIVMANPAPQLARAAAAQDPGLPAPSQAEPGLFERARSATDPPPANTSGEADPDRDATASGAVALPIELGGYLRSAFFAGKVPERSRGDIKAAYSELALRLRTESEKYGQALAELRFRQGFSGEDPGLSLELREAYVSLYLGALDLRLGQQIIVWGRADAFNPTNNITPFDFGVRSAIEDDRRRGNVGARAFYSLAPLRLEAVWMPVYVPALLPGLELNEYVSVSDTDFPPAELENGLGALRVHVELPSFELSASYLYGHAPLPGFALGSFTVGQDPPEVRIARTAYAQHVVGFDFSTAFGELLALRGEAAYRRPTSEERRVYEPRPDLQYVLGIDRAFGDLSVIVQYIGRYVFDWQRELGPDMPVQPEALIGFMEPLGPLLEESITTSIDQELAVRNQVVFSQRARVQHLASARLEWTGLHDTLSLSALGLANFTTREVLFYPKLGYRVSDAMTAYFGAEIYTGPNDTLLGLIEEPLSAGYAELRVGF